MTFSSYYTNHYGHQINHFDHFISSELFTLHKITFSIERISCLAGSLNTFSVVLSRQENSERKHKEFLKVLTKTQRGLMNTRIPEKNALVFIIKCFMFTFFSIRTCNEMMRRTTCLAHVWYDAETFFFVDLFYVSRSCLAQFVTTVYRLPWTCSHGDDFITAIKERISGMQ